MPKKHKGARKGKKKENLSTVLLEQIASNTMSNVGMTTVDLMKEQKMFPNAERFDTEVYNCFDSSESSAFLTSNAALGTFANVVVTASSLSNFSDMSAAFDQYRIKSVQAIFYARTNAVTVNTSNLGLVHSVIDYDDGNALTSAVQALAYSNCFVVGGNENFNRVFEPHVAMAAYSGAFTSFANLKDQWIDCASPGVQHYGLKTAWTATDAVYKYDLVVRVWIQYRNSR